jgi:hypothetical protein
MYKKLVLRKLISYERFKSSIFDYTQGISNLICLIVHNIILNYYGHDLYQFGVVFRKTDVVQK